jgi:hypothetical protein
MLNPRIKALVAAFPPERLARELTFAMPYCDLGEKTICEWVACELARHIELLPGRPATGGDSPIAGLFEEITSALEGDSNDAEHDALVSVAQQFGLVWTPPDE